MRLFGRRRFGVLAFVALVLAWSSAFSVVKVGLDYAPPVLFAGGRTLLSGVIMTFVALAWGGNPNLRRDWRVFVFLGAFNVVLFIGAQSFAVLYLPSGTAAVLIYLQPILVGVFAWTVLGEPLTTTKIAGLLLGFAGIVAVSSAGLLNAAGEVTLVGVVFGVASALSWALGTVGFKKYEARISTLWAVALPFLLGGIVLTTLGLLVERPSDVSWTGPLVWSVLYSAFVGTGLAWLLFFGLVRAGEASRVASFIFVVPLAAVVIGAVVLDEALGPPLLAGAALIVSGIYLVNRTPRETEKASR
ncbi:MAG: Permease of the drug/metabolite transporter (DMT) superfamily [uncultured Rubrobacteraceae bacterium]|uniref:Permease of the drug/metabolite transporter (DMT) superfamily n=1 Tax=uncultured Rubrobacteraceae bacterium TaxID=349277 RepID=A0A6J4PQJ8_9ACTN|nr:MAG: Permease of the drug/metabolite transporter (DMT) superfamily [uncultured Rubrobacteraceae bacterium]